MGSKCWSLWLLVCAASAADLVFRDSDSGSRCTIQKHEGRQLINSECDVSVGDDGPSIKENAASIAHLTQVMQPFANKAAFVAAVAGAQMQAEKLAADQVAADATKLVAAAAEATAGALAMTQTAHATAAALDAAVAVTAASKALADAKAEVQRLAERECAYVAKMSYYGKYGRRGWLPKDLYFCKCGQRDGRCRRAQRNYNAGWARDKSRADSVAAAADTAHNQALEAAAEAARTAHIARGTGVAGARAVNKQAHTAAADAAARALAKSRAAAAAQDACVAAGAALRHANAVSNAANAGAGIAAMGQVTASLEKHAAAVATTATSAKAQVDALAHLVSVTTAAATATGFFSHPGAHAVIDSKAKAAKAAAGAFAAAVTKASVAKAAVDAEWRV